jgi:hypothetical protein
LRAREENAEDTDGVLIDFRIGRAHHTLQEAIALQHELLRRLNARPGAGVNFALVFDIVRAERAVEDAREALRSIRLVAGDKAPASAKAFGAEVAFSVPANCPADSRRRMPS